MEQFSLIEFLTMSIPEEFLLSFFIWTILGKKDTVKFYNVITVALITSIAFASINFICNSNTTLTAILNLIILTVTIFFLYNSSFLEAIVAALLAFIVLTITQAVVTNIGLIVTNYSFNDIERDEFLKRMLFVASFLIFSIITLILFKLNLKVLNFKKKHISIYYLTRVRYVVLQLLFTFLIIIFNFRIYWSNKELFNSFSDKVLIAMNLAFVVIFTVVIVVNVFKMRRDIQKEEEQKRVYDNREVFQNIDYLCRLMEYEDYNEVKNILISMKNDVNSDMKAKKN